MIEKIFTLDPTKGKQTIQVGRVNRKVDLAATTQNTISLTLEVDEGSAPSPCDAWVTKTGDGTVIPNCYFAGTVVVAGKKYSVRVTCMA